MIQENFIKLYEHSFRENWDLPCYTDYGENEELYLWRSSSVNCETASSVQVLQTAPRR